MTDRTRYLFLRILEACNADCFMCDFALSRDTYRFSVEEFAELLPRARAAGVGYVRFTGGEPLMHREILDLVRTGAEHGMGMSLITNGLKLPQMIGPLADAGLRHLMVSLDGGSAGTHDVYRRLPGSFANGLTGIREANRLGLVTRVNTVVGPHNFDQMPQLKETLTAAGTQQWELSSLKLERTIVYPDPDKVREICDPIYEADPAEVLVPLGKRFYGDTPEEQERFFTDSVTPRAGLPLCHVTDDVIYVDAKRGLGFACSCISHSEDTPGVQMREDGRIVLDSPRFREHAEEFRTSGPVMCGGCSATAAGYSDDVARMGRVPEWHY